MRKSSKILVCAIVLLACAAAILFWAIYQEDRKGLLTVSFLDVGQGDAIFIDAPSGRQALIDGGKGAAVLRELGKRIPWWDRSIDVMIATHPDLDHIGGLVDVLERYKVGLIVESSVLDDEGTDSKAFDKAAEDEKTERLLAMRGQKIDLADEAYIEILFPDREVPHVDTNVGCIVSRVVYKNTSFMLPCDATAAIENYLAALDGEKLKSNVLKAAHHGSKTSSASLFVGYVSPEYAIYSRGCDNSYGHPHQATIDTYARFQIPTLDTCTEGTITLVSDGQIVRRK